MLLLWGALIVAAAVIAALDAPVGSSTVWTVMLVLGLLVAIVLWVARRQAPNLGERLARRGERARFLAERLAAATKEGDAARIELTLLQGGPEAVALALLAVQAEDERVQRAGAETLVDCGEDALPAIRAALLETSASGRPWLEAARRRIQGAPTDRWDEVFR
jgi:hypothetical protein